MPRGQGVRGSVGLGGAFGLGGSEYGSVRGAVRSPLRGPERIGRPGCVPERGAKLTGARCA